MKTTSELMGHAFDRVLNRWRREKVEPNFALPPAQQKPPWTVAISRETGSGGEEIAQLIGRKLGWEVFDRNLLDAIAAEHGLRAELLQCAEESRRDWLVEMVEHLLVRGSIGSGLYARRLGETLLTLAARGHCVIVGRGATALLPPDTTLRVRLVAPLLDRVRRTMQTHILSQRDAERFVAKTDKERREFAKAYFHRGVDLYDLTLNTSRFSLAHCADVIASALPAHEIAP